MQKFVAAAALLVFSLGVATADEFMALVKKVDGNTVTLLKIKGFGGGKGGKGTKGEKPEDTTLTALDSVKVSKGKRKFNTETKKMDVEGLTTVSTGLKSDLFKEAHQALVTTDDNNKITEIKLLNVNEFQANIKKVDGKKITLVKSVGFGFGGGGNAKEGDEVTLTAADKVKVTKSKFDTETKKLETTDVEGGLTNEMFKSSVRGTVTVSDDGKVIEIRIGGGRGGFGGKKKQAD